MLGFILGITNRGRFQGLQVGAKEITIMGSLRDYKSGNKDYKSRQGVQIGAREITKQGQGIINGAEQFQMSTFWNHEKYRPLLLGG